MFPGTFQRKNGTLNGFHHTNLFMVGTFFEQVEPSHHVSLGKWSVLVSYQSKVSVDW